MKKIKIAFMAIAFAGGIGSAFAFTKGADDPCAGATLYYKDSAGHFHEVTATGFCSNTSGNCKYYNNGSGFVACDTGIYGQGPYNP